MEVGEMPDRETLMYLVAKGLSTSREAADLQEAVDQGRGTRWGADVTHRRAAEMLEFAAARLQTLSDAHNKAQS
jgi:hypothetical protein